jgi:uncharacterized protein (TIGR03083 family)
MTTQRAMARQERCELADFLATLTPADWSVASLCAGWTVKEVVSHVYSYEELGVAGLVRRFAQGRIVHANQVGVEDYASWSTDRLVALARDHVEPRGLTAAFGGMIALVDGTIHHQDIRRPLGQPRHIPEERLLRVLRLTVGNPRLGVPLRIRGVRLCADDLNWSHGRGAEVTGRAEALLMAMAGRAAVLGELSGPGVPILASRL